MVSFENAPHGSDSRDVFVRIFNLRDSHQVGTALKLEYLKMEGTQRLTSSSCACRFVADDKVLFVQAARYKNRANQFCMLKWDKKQLAVDPLCLEPKEILNDGQSSTPARYVRIDDGRTHAKTTHGEGCEVQVVLWNPDQGLYGEGALTVEYIDGEEDEELDENGEEISADNNNSTELEYNNTPSLEVYTIKTGNKGGTDLLTSHEDFHRKNQYHRAFGGVAGLCCAVSPAYVAYAINKPLNLKRPKHLRSKPLGGMNDRVGQMVVRSLPSLKKKGSHLHHLEDKLPQSLRLRSDAKMSFIFQVGQRLK
jgi:hypothetical protein